MVKKIENTEERIIFAAREVFFKKGMDGARMQEIANEAGINKSLLHYYFRTKDKLFERVFADTFGGVIDAINSVFTKSNTLESFIENFVIEYTNALKKNPFLPNFVMHELNRNPQRIVDYINSSVFDKTKIILLLASENKNNLSSINPIQLIVDIIGLCVFPFIAKPIITGFMFDGNSEDFDDFLEQRTQHIIDFLKTAIFINK